MSLLAIYTGGQYTGTMITLLWFCLSGSLVPLLVTHQVFLGLNVFTPAKTIKVGHTRWFEGTRPCCFPEYKRPKIKLNFELK